MNIQNILRNKRLVTVLTFFLAVPVSAALAADEYYLDTSHTSVEFTAQHMVLSKVKGGFADVAGTIMYDEKDVTKSSVEVVIKVASISTNNEKRDDHLKSGDFFDAANHPDITFKSTKIEKSEKGLVMFGVLTIRGVSKEVFMPFEMTGTVKDPWGAVRFGAETKLEINRQDYGVSWNKILDNGGLVVSDKIKIEISLEAIQKDQT